MTHAQTKIAREKDITRLMDRTGLSERDCRRIMTSFYRLSAREQRLMELENDATVYEHRRAWLDRENDRNYAWMLRLTKELSPFSLRVGLRGGYAHIDIVYPDTTGVGTFTNGHYYE